MSYCRNNGTDSDVYVIKTIMNQLECIGCSMMPIDDEEHGQFFQTDSYSEMVRHLNQHSDLGDRVPKRAIERLHREEINGDRVEPLV